MRTWTKNTARAAPDHRDHKDSVRGGSNSARFLIGAILIVPVILIVTVSTVIGQSVASVTPNSSTIGIQTSDRDSYTHKAQDDLKDWQGKLRGFRKEAEASGRKDLAAAEIDLNAAWSKTESETHKLEKASDEDWQRARRSYEKAAHVLSADWAKAQKEM